MKIIQIKMEKLNVLLEKSGRYRSESLLSFPLTTRSNFCGNKSASSGKKRAPATMILNAKT